MSRLLQIGKIGHPQARMKDQGQTMTGTRVKKSLVAVIVADALSNHVLRNIFGNVNRQILHRIVSIFVCNLVSKIDNLKLFVTTEIQATLHSNLVGQNIRCDTISSPFRRVGVAPMGAATSAPLLSQAGHLRLNTPIPEVKRADTNFNSCLARRSAISAALNTVILLLSLPTRSLTCLVTSWCACETKVAACAAS